MKRETLWQGFSLQGPRPRQDDRFLVLESSEGLLIVVCDGHGTDGDLAAAYAVDELVGWFSRKPTDQGITNLFEDVDQTIEVDFEGGTTATVVWLKPNGETVIAYVGDSEVYAVDTRTKEVVSLLPRLHSVSDLEEERRLRSAGAKLGRGRILLGNDRGINVARSLGDRDYCRFVIPEPTIVRLTPERNAPFSHLLVCSDGVSRAVRSLGRDDNWNLFIRGGIDRGSEKAKLYLEVVATDNATGVLVDLEIWRQRCS
ncbi:MAG: PP2C family protein-serine/threonine phosphatase [Candidatus Uhrbacteria bacterium]